MPPLSQSNVPGYPCRRGKVRDVYDLGDPLVLVATDRISAFDSLLPTPIFTPATKEESGHDQNISFVQMTAITGPPVAAELRDRSIDVYRRAADHARSRGIILADTKFEWGKLPSGEIILIDEVLTPDSSRFWPLDSYCAGSNPPSFDKQFVRDWLENSGWDKNSPPPELPADIVDRTRAKYLEA